MFTSASDLCACILISHFNFKQVLNTLAYNFEIGEANVDYGFHKF